MLLKNRGRGLLFENPSRSKPVSALIYGCPYHKLSLGHPRLLYFLK